MRLNRQQYSQLCRNLAPDGKVGERVRFDAFELAIAKLEDEGRLPDDQVDWILDEEGPERPHQVVPLHGKLLRAVNRHHEQDRQLTSLPHAPRILHGERRCQVPDDQ